MIVSYLVSLPEPLTLPSAAYLRIEIRDTSLIDAPSITLAAMQLSADQVSNRSAINGEITLPENISPKAMVTLWAHLSLSGENQINKGDFITTKTFPITKTDEHGQVIIEMQSVSR